MIQHSFIPCSARRGVSAPLALLSAVSSPHAGGDNVASLPRRSSTRACCTRADRTRTAENVDGNQRPAPVGAGLQERP